MNDKESDITLELNLLDNGVDSFLKELTSYLTKNMFSGNTPRLQIYH